MLCIEIGCGTAPSPTPFSSPDAAASPTTQPPTSPSRQGRVVAQSDRFVIYLPGAEDTLRTIAGRFLGDEDKDWSIGEFNEVSMIEPGRPLVVPLKTLNPVGVTFDQYQTVPILCYHRFGSGGGKMVVSPSTFAQQLEWLARNDFHVVRLSQLVDFLKGRQALPRRSVVITIDDGYESVHRHALPLLRKYGFPATLFIYSDFVGARDALNWPQLQELVASGLIDIGAHSKTHRNLLERISGESDAQHRQSVELEARAPREILERRLSVPVRQFAFPYGDADGVVLEVLTRQQYQLAVTVNPGGNPFFAQPLMLRRTMIFGDLSLEAFRSKLQTGRAIGGAP